MNPLVAEKLKTMQWYYKLSIHATLVFMPLVAFIPSFAYAGGGPGILDAKNYIPVIDADTQAHGGFSAIEHFSPAYNDGPTRDRLCQIINPGSQVVSYTESRFVSPRDNKIAKWNGTSWGLFGAHGNNKAINTIICQKDAGCAEGTDGIGHKLTALRQVAFGFVYTSLPTTNTYSGEGINLSSSGGNFVPALPIQNRVSHDDLLADLPYQPEGVADFLGDVLAHGGFPGTLYYQERARIYNDPATLARVCEVLLPGSSVISFKNRQFNYYLYNDTVFIWNGSQWVIEKAKGHDDFVNDITCGIYTDEICLVPGDLCINIPGTQSSLPSGYHMEDGQCVSNESAQMCPDGTSLPSGGVCVGEDGDVCSNIIGIQTSVPASYIAVNGVCVLASEGCPSGYVLQGDQCVAVAGACPSGSMLVNGVCEAIMCSAGHFCSGNNLYYQDDMCSATFVRSCTYGCEVNACMYGGEISAAPIIVRQGETSTITWNLIAEPSGPTVQPSSCSVVGTNGDVFSGQSGTHQTSALSAKTTYTFSCDGRALDTTTVHILPSWKER